MSFTDRIKKTPVVSRTTVKKWLIAGPVLLFLTVFAYFPFGLIVWNGIVQWDKSSLLKNEIALSLTWKAAWFSVWISVLTVFFAAVAGMPVGWIIGRKQFPGKRVVVGLLTVPFIMPPIFVVLGVSLALGPHGLLGVPLRAIGISSRNLTTGVLPVLVGHVFYNAPLFVSWTAASAARIEETIEDAADTLGSQGFHKLRRVFLPFLIRGFLPAAVISFMYSLLSFAIVLALAAPKYNTVELWIYIVFYTYRDEQFAAILALFQSILTGFLVWQYVRLTDRMEEQSFREEGSEFHTETSWTIPEFIVLAILLIFDIIPFAETVRFAFYQRDTGTFGFANFANLFTDRSAQQIGASVPRVILNTLYFGTVAALMALVCSIAIAFATWQKAGRTETFLGWLTMAPLALSGVTLAFGLHVAYNRFAWYSNYPFIPLIAAYGAMSIPYAYRSIRSGLLSMDSNVLDSARLLGESDLGVLVRVVLPQMREYLRIAVAFSFAMVIGEFAATTFLARSTTTTLSLAIYRFVGVRRMGEAAALSSLLMVISAGIFMLIQSTGSKRKPHQQQGGQM